MLSSLSFSNNLHNSIILFYYIYVKLIFCECFMNILYFFEYNLIKGLTFFFFSNIIFLFIYRGVEQLAARRAHNPKVGGSSPPPATTITKSFKTWYFYLNMLNSNYWRCYYEKKSKRH